MKKSFTILSVVLIALLIYTGTTLYLNSNRPNQKMLEAQDYSREIPKKTGLVANVNFGQIPLYFIPNKGQVDSNVLFYTKTQNYTLWLANNGMTFDRILAENNFSIRDRTKGLSINKRGTRCISQIHFIGVNKNTKVIPDKNTAGRVNYLCGKDSTKWHKNIATSEGIVYEEIYNGINLKIYGKADLIEYDWVIKPDGTPKNIQFEFQGAKKTGIKKTGDLFVRCKASEFVHKKPNGYQIIDGKKCEVEVKFKSLRKNTYGFEIDNYNHDYPLVIDPLLLVFSSIIGGAEGDICRDIAVDKEGAIYVTGTTYSTDFPTTPPAYREYGGFRALAFVTKLSPDGSTLEYSTYLGGDEYDSARGIVADDNGAAYVTGFTISPDFPTTEGAFDETYNNGYDVFITKLDPSGSDLVYSTFLGAGAMEFSSSIALNNQGAVYVTGDTRSPNFPTIPGSFDTKYNGNRDVFVTKLDPSGTTLEYSTFLGAGSGEFMGQIEVDDRGSAYVAGWTYSRHFPTTPLAVDPEHNGGMDVFITKLNSTGSALEYSTYLGGSGDDRFYGLALDDTGATYVTGYTKSMDFPITPGAYDATLDGKRDIFITKLNPFGTGFVYSTFLGGSSIEQGEGLAVDQNGYLHATGYTQSQDFPVTEDAFDQMFNKDKDVFLTILTPLGTELIYSTFFGGSHVESGWAITIGQDSAIYIGGGTRSFDFPTFNDLENIRNVSTGVFVAKFTALTDTTTPQISITTPKEGEIVSQPMSVEAFVSDDNEVLKVEFYVDNKLVFTDTSEPYSFIWETLHYKNGPHQISGIAFDIEGNTSGDVVNVTVQDLKTSPWWEVPKKPERIEISSPLFFLNGISL